MEILQLQLALAKLSLLIIQIAMATGTPIVADNQIRENSVKLAINDEKVSDRALDKENALYMANFAKESGLNTNLDQTSTTIKRYIAEIAEKHEIPVERMLWIAEKESQFETNRVGDLDKKCPDGTQMRSRGLWQITNCWHDISDEEAFSVVSSTLLILPYLKNNPKIWSTYKFCHQWYSDCPF